MRQPQRRTKNRSRKKLHNQQWSIQRWRKRREATLQIHSRNTSWATQNITGQGPLDMALQMQKSFNSKDTVGGQNPIASFHLTDHARIWFIQFEHNKGTPSWSQFSSAFQKHFGPPCGDNSLWKLSELRQQGPMEEYTDQFMEQLAKTNNLNQTQQTMLYMAGAELSELLHIETELINLRT